MNAILAALRRVGFAKDEMSGHGFWAMARTILDEVLQVRPGFIEHQLAHAVRDPNGRAYNRTAHLAERRKMMQQWADYLDKLKAGAEVRKDRGQVLQVKERSGSGLARIYLAMQDLTPIGVHKLLRTLKKKLEELWIRT